MMVGVTDDVSGGLPDDVGGSLPDDVKWGTYQMMLGGAY